MFVKPKISRPSAANILSAKKSFFPLTAKLFSGKNPRLPERLEIVYLPFYVFEVLVFPSGQNVALSVDGLLGHAVLYAETSLEIDKDLVMRTCDFELLPSAAEKIAMDQYRGILLEHGLRTRSHPQAKEISEGKKIFYPFWVGYFKNKKGFYDFKALDAVSGEIQGIKMRRVFIKALRQLG
jgi:hypothetical protein